MDRRDFLLATGTLAMSQAATASQAMAASGERIELAQAAPAHENPPAATATIEQRLADFATGLRYEDLPRDVVDAVKRLLIDTLACGYGALGAPPAHIAEAAFRRAFAGVPACSVLGGREKISLEGAALVNGILVRYLDLNDIYVGRDPSHPSECIPSAIACCEEAGAGGGRLIEAIVIGYEAQLSLIDAFSFSDRGFHSLSCAGVAVPLIAGKVWGLSPPQMADAIGIAFPRQMTTLAINSGPISMMKALPYGHNAMDSIFAARLAAAGFTGAGGAIAWFAAHVKTVRPDNAWSVSSKDFRITRVGMKRFPLQFELQSIAEAGVNLHAAVAGHGGDIKEVMVETYPSTIERTADASKYHPNTRETADHSLPVCLAMALLDGDVTIAQLNDGRWKSADVLALAQKVKTGVSDKLVAAAPRGTGALVRVTMADGHMQETLVEIADGDPRRPMSPAAVEHKFMQFAVPHLGEAGARKVLDQVARLENLDDLHDLTAALREAEFVRRQGRDLVNAV